MSKNLVLVESPAKGKTIEKYLGTDFKVLATYGHVRDLVSKTGAVIPDQGFEMNYEISEDSKKQLTRITKAVEQASARTPAMRAIRRPHTPELDASSVILIAMSSPESYAGNRIRSTLRNSRDSAARDSSGQARG